MATLYSGDAFVVAVLEADGIAEVKFDLKNESVNKFNKLALEDLRKAVDALKSKIHSQPSAVKGVLFTSGKEAFIVGADVTEFLSYFKVPEAEFLGWIGNVNALFNEIEDLPVPTLALINGYALGGGCEFALTMSYRVMATTAKIGLPEVKLGLYPGWGGTVRLPRVIGADNAIEWIAAGSENKAEVALKMGVVDAVVTPEKLREAGMDLLKRAIRGNSDWQARRQIKVSPLKLISPIEANMVFEGSKAFISAAAGPNYPAPLAAITTMQAGAGCNREKALAHEASGFAKLAKTSVAENLVTLFLSDQFNKKKAKKLSKGAGEVGRAAVLGAGIMGGGVAYQSASKGKPIIMKDIQTKALEIGMGEATKLLNKLVETKRMDTLKMAQTLTSIVPTLNYGDFGTADIVVEAVVESEKIKKAVLAEVEEKVRPGTVLTSNTSTISISLLAEALKRPEDFCGMHFFNPVHKMPLVEIIRGKKSSDRAIATTVAYATAMGKTPVVVNDCPGFLVNRVLFPYFGGFMNLLTEGVDFQRIDKVMEKFGWPMGPAYLLDVVGLDTALHASEVMAKGFPDRMKFSDRNILHVMNEQKRFGQKNNVGFYKYTADKKGRPVKEVDSAVAILIQPLIKESSVKSATAPKQISDEEIVDRLMVPMINESSRCLEDKIVDTPMEADLGLIYGLGFPPFRGGALKYADSLGLAAFCEKAGKYAPTYGKLYDPPALVQNLAKANKTFYEGHL